MPTPGFKYTGYTYEQVFKDYEAFIQKFKEAREKTTDECITPPEVYFEVLRWVSEHVDIEGRSIVRPFYPGGDFEKFDYPERCIVVDNPPFSIRSKITCFYLERGIDFFLFNPALTLFMPHDVTYVLTNASVRFDNGAELPISFTTSLFPDVRIMTAHDLREALGRIFKKAIGASNKKQKHFVWPPCVLSAARGNFWDVDVKIKKSECQFTRKPCGCKSAYGGAFMLSDAATQRVEAAMAATRFDKLTLQLSESDRAIIARLNAQNDKG